ncbi:hypothetical protein WT83_24800 [Burkholderia territorii]|uniref:DUF4062 domain-containing protein n=1 Tax=Burkholderia territorii TaxID=1503055 RepID=A0A108EB13_9BURK|nr:DUF4062 domain-containing protein [Burkholderia territorii]KWN07970.1 hypothetical protein WT83_24800 [Burkholderia territorii]
MNKKYQIFISSTFLDMKAERQAAVEAILDAGHIPAGMELFAATDKEQIEVIKGWIDSSDIFMLILGGRYGSIEPDSGKSYIHLEYEHAISTGKPFFALYLTDKALNDKVRDIGIDATEQGDTKALNEFRKLVKSKLCSEIEDVKDIKINVPKSIRHLAETRKLEGWVRASDAPDISPLLVQLKALQDENAALKEAASDVGAVKRDFEWTTEGSVSKEDLQAPLQLEFSGRQSGSIQPIRSVWTGTYLQMFILLATKMIEEPRETEMHAYLNRVVVEQVALHNIYRLSVAERDYQDMKMRFVALRLITLAKINGELRWMLTEDGKALMMQHHAGKHGA